MRTDCCIVMPTYNNFPFLPEVLEGLRDSGLFVFVVNDGSTDNTFDFLQNTNKEYIKHIYYTPNRGKARALCAGFEAAMKAGYTHALTMDADGQHLPGDIPAFLREMEAHPDALVIGCRQNLVEAGQSTRSGFANRFANFWFRVQTAKKIADTQSGFRLYPLAKMGGIRPMTGRYDGELELLVRCAWREIPIRGIPVHVYYPPRDIRITHFRPFTDFFRISVLNTLLCLISWVYYYPKKAWKGIFCPSGSPRP